VGVWGGLWGFPECRPGVSAADHCHATLGLQIKTETPWPVRLHGFSHFKLHITPIPARLTGTSRLGKAGLHNNSHVAMECAPAVWYNPDKPDARGLAAPVKRLLQQLRKASLHKNSHVRKAGLHKTSHKRNTT